jgi:hypothetical protein
MPFLGEDMGTVPAKMTPSGSVEKRRKHRAFGFKADQDIPRQTDSFPDFRHFLRALSALRACTSPTRPNCPTVASSLLGLGIVEERVAEQRVAGDDERTNSAETKRQR